MILKWTEIALDDETVAIDTITTPNCSKGRERKKEYIIGDSSFLNYLYRLHTQQ